MRFLKHFICYMMYLHNLFLIYMHCVGVLSSILFWVLLIVFYPAGPKPFRRHSESIASLNAQLLCSDWDNRQWWSLWQVKFFPFCISPNMSMFYSFRNSIILIERILWHWVQIYLPFVFLKWMFEFLFRNWLCMW